MFSNRPERVVKTFNFINKRKFVMLWNKSAKEIREAKANFFISINDSKGNMKLI